MTPDLKQARQGTDSRRELGYTDHEQLAAERTLADVVIAGIQAQLDEAQASLTMVRHQMKRAHEVLDAAGVPALVELPGGELRGLGFGERIDRLAEERDGRRAELELLRGPECRVCGCTEHEACEGGCSWIEGDLCSECEGKEPEASAPTTTVRIDAGELARAWGCSMHGPEKAAVVCDICTAAYVLRLRAVRDSARAVCDLAVALEEKGYTNAFDKACRALGEALEACPASPPTSGPVSDDAPVLVEQTFDPDVAREQMAGLGRMLGDVSRAVAPAPGEAPEIVVDASDAPDRLHGTSSAVVDDSFAPPEPCWSVSPMGYRCDLVGGHAGLHRSTRPAGEAWATEEWSDLVATPAPEEAPEPPRGKIVQPPAVPVGPGPDGECRLLHPGTCCRCGECLPELVECAAGEHCEHWWQGKGEHRA